MNPFMMLLLALAFAADDEDYESLPPRPLPLWLNVTLNVLPLIGGVLLIVQGNLS